MLPPESPDPQVEVAIILPTYNCGPYLAEAIESVLAQTYRNFRLYVIDDGSTDETAEIMQRYAGRCVYLWQPNAGCAAARNHGIRVSSSPYIAFLDADDLWHPTKLECQVPLIRQQMDVGIVSSDFSITGGNLPTIDSFFARNGTPPDGRIFDVILDHGLGANLSCMIIRRQVFEELGMFNESLVVRSDMNMWLRIAAYWKIATVPEVLTTIRRRQGSLSATNGNTIVSLKAGLLAHQHVESVCPDLLPHEKRALRRKLAHLYSMSGSTELTAGNHRQARRYLATALRYKTLNFLVLAKLGGSFLPTSVFSFFARIYRVMFR